MSLMSALQQSNQQELNLHLESGRNPDRSSEAIIAAHLSESPTGQDRLMESILERENMNRAYQQVVSNKGAGGVDGMTVGQLRAYLDHHWTKIEASLLNGSYEPMPARRKEIEKQSGGVRLLGIPTVLDRLIQQGIAQVLEKVWDHTFSESSYGFRPNRSQREAIAQCRQHVTDGLRFCVDIDLSKFFDRSNHDRLMSRLALKVQDKRVLKLIGKYLGFSLTSTRAQPRIKLHWKTLDQLKVKIRYLTGRQRGRSLQSIIAELNEYLRGWWGYFNAMETPYQLAQVAGCNLMKLGIYEETALKTGCARKG